MPFINEDLIIDINTVTFLKTSLGAQSVDLDKKCIFGNKGTLSV